MQLEVVNRVQPTLVPDGHPLMTGPFTPNYVECNATELEVIGEIPRDLDGVYLRNTQNPVHQPRGRYHAFDGDGMLHLMSFQGGRCEYRNRFIPTKGFVEEREAGRALYAGLIDNPRVAERPRWPARHGRHRRDRACRLGAGHLLPVRRTLPHGCTHAGIPRHRRLGGPRAGRWRHLRASQGGPAHG